MGKPNIFVADNPPSYALVIQDDIRCPDILEWDPDGLHPVILSWIPRHHKVPPTLGKEEKWQWSASLLHQCGRLVIIFELAGLDKSPDAFGCFI